MADIYLNQPFPGGNPSPSFFNGRLLSAEDLLAEQGYQRQSRRLLGQAIGDGVVQGLVVSELDRTNAKLRVDPGMAITRKGDTLWLPDRVDLALVRPPDASLAAPALFSACRPPQAGVYVTAGEGAYLLAVAPASFNNGKAPASGLSNAEASCTTRSTVDTVQFRLIPLSSANLADAAKARNRIAYQCFGAPLFARDPFGQATETNLLEALRPALLTDCDVPLAVVSWGDSGLRFVDNWSVRRRPTPPSTGRLGGYLGSNRRRQAEAMMLQFDEQIRQMSTAEMASMKAVDRFEMLPPAGLVPVSGATSGAGFKTTEFFGSLALAEIATLDASSLGAILRDALDFEPVPLNGSRHVRLYTLLENSQGIANATVSQAALVFTSAAMPYRGVARFGSAQWNINRFAGEI